MEEIHLNAQERSRRNKEITEQLRRIDGPGIYKAPDPPSADEASHSDVDEDTGWHSRHRRPSLPVISHRAPTFTSRQWFTDELLPPGLGDLKSALRIRQFKQFVEDTKPPRVITTRPDTIGQDNTEDRPRQVPQCEETEAQLTGSGYAQSVRCGTQFDAGDLNLWHNDWNEDRSRIHCLVNQPDGWAAAEYRDQKRRFHLHMLGHAQGSNRSSPRGSVSSSPRRGSSSHGSPHLVGSRAFPYGTPPRRRASASHSSPRGSGSGGASGHTTPVRSATGTPQHSPRKILPAPSSARLTGGDIDIPPESPTLQVPALFRPRSPSTPDDLRYLNAPMFMWRKKLDSEGEFPAESVFVTDQQYYSGGVLPPWDSGNAPTPEDAVKFNIWATETMASHMESSTPFRIHCQMPPNNSTIWVPNGNGGYRVGFEGGSRFTLVSNGRPDAEATVIPVKMIPDDGLLQSTSQYAQECDIQARAMEKYWDNVRDALGENPASFTYGLSTLWPTVSRRRSSGSQAS